MRIKILRQQSPSTEPYWETFRVDDIPKDMTVAGLLEHINYNDDIADENGRKTTRIGWECSCLQGSCGACAMVINDIPALACETFIRDIKKDVITIRPLRKFPVVHDLMVDRSGIYENLKKMNMYIGEYHPAKEKDPEKKQKAHDLQYDIAKCLKCGLCLEVCPNYVNGSSFFGAVFANDCYLVSSRNDSKEKAVLKTYDKHFASTCSKSFSCMDVCPVKIRTITAMAEMNRK
ncbi:MAG: 4Fe-4S dicluster domain-containing protein [Lachnospiraceae bacterium]|nr:4Fe-4S dicluster domain-containing protein [Lachnospiraceae bacterium]